MTEQQIKQLLLHKPKDARLSEWLPAQVSAIEAIKTEVAEIRKQRAELADRHKKEQLVLANSYAAVKRKCQHQLTQYHPDASGNNDSWYECLICGAADV